MAALRILAVDDEPHVLALCRDLLAEDGIAVETAAGTDDAIAKLRDGGYDLVLTDLRMPGRDGMALLRDARRMAPGLPVVMITGYPSIDGTVDAVRNGAADVVTKPFDIDRLRQVVQRALIGRAGHGRALPGGIENGPAPAPLLGESAAMIQLRELLGRAARSDSNVLIHGESGTGKELAARHLHALSPRCGEPFVLLDCAAVPADRIARELFGEAEAGGCLAAARGGTLFLDGVTELSPALQARLLRVLDGEPASAGDPARVIAAALGDLREAIRAGRFREDLFFRLGVIPVRMPPLRERPDDVPLLAREFLSELGGGDGLSFSDECMQRLRSHSWPGNVRELRTVVERMVCLAQGADLRPTDLPPEILAGGAPATTGDRSFREAKRSMVERFERDYLHRLLSRHDGHVTRAARSAGLNRTAFQRLMRKHRLRSEAYRPAVERVCT